MRTSRIPTIEAAWDVIKAQASRFPLLSRVRLYRESIYQGSRDQKPYPHLYPEGADAESRETRARFAREKLEKEAQEVEEDRRDDERREEAREVGIALFAHPRCEEMGSWERERWWLEEL